MELALLVSYIVLGTGIFLWITEGPLERWLRKRNPALTLDDIKSWQDRLVFVWVIISLSFLVFWFIVGHSALVNMPERR